VIDLQSNVERTLTDRAGEYTSLSYSPDGRFIVFNGRPENSRGNVIFVLRINTGELTQISDNSVDSSQPAWSR
jgi:Tol biopolymer transport system component